jgi:transposase
MLTGLGGPIWPAPPSLTKAGKPFKLAMTACMRKLLTILNAILKNNQSWKIQPTS